MEEDINNLRELCIRNTHFSRDINGKGCVERPYYIKAIENVLKELETSKNENIKKDKVIQEMAEELNTYDIDDDICGKFGKNKDCSDFTNENLCINCIKEYFYKKVEEEKNTQLQPHTFPLL